MPSAAAPHSTASICRTVGVLTRSLRAFFASAPIPRPPVLRTSEPEAQAGVWLTPLACASGFLPPVPSMATHERQGKLDRPPPLDGDLDPAGRAAVRLLGARAVS